MGLLFNSIPTLSSSLPTIPISPHASNSNHLPFTLPPTFLFGTSLTLPRSNSYRFLPNNYCRATSTTASFSLLTMKPLTGTLEKVQSKLNSSANIFDMKILSRCDRQKVGPDYRRFRVYGLFGGKKDNNEKSDDAPSKMVSEGDKVVCNGGIGSEEAQVSKHRNRGTPLGDFS